MNILYFSPRIPCKLHPLNPPILQELEERQV